MLRQKRRRAGVSRGQGRLVFLVAALACHVAAFGPRRKAPYCSGKRSREGLADAALRAPIPTPRVASSAVQPWFRAKAPGLAAGMGAGGSGRVPLVLPLHGEARRAARAKPRGPFVFSKQSLASLREHPQPVASGGCNGQCGTRGEGGCSTDSQRFAAHPTEIRVRSGSAGPSLLDQ